MTGKLCDPKILQIGYVQRFLTAAVSRSPSPFLVLQAFALRPPSPMRTAASFSTLPTAASLRSPRATSNSIPFTPKFGGSGAMRVRTPASRSKGEGKAGKEGKAKAAARRRMSAER